MAASESAVAGPVVAKVMGFANGVASPWDGKWIVAWNPHVRSMMPNKVTLEVTDDATKARRFPDSATLFAEWKTISEKRSWRPDGNPNRPLTAINLVVEPAPGAAT